MFAIFIILDYMLGGFILFFLNLYVANVHCSGLKAESYTPILNLIRIYILVQFTFNSVFVYMVWWL